MKYFIKLLIIIIFFQSCYTVKKAQRQVIKADLTYQEMFTDYITKSYPTKDSVIEKIKTIKGEDIVKVDTIKVIDCDSIVNDNIDNNKVLVRFKTIYRTDTIQTIKEVFKENTSKITNLNLQIKQLKEDNTILKQKVKSTNKYKSYFFILIGIIGIGLFFKFR